VKFGAVSIHRCHFPSTAKLVDSKLIDRNSQLIDCVNWSTVLYKMLTGRQAQLIDRQKLIDRLTVRQLYKPLSCLSLTWGLLLLDSLSIWLWQRLASLAVRSNLSRAFPAFPVPMPAWFWQRLTSFEGHSNLSNLSVCPIGASFACRSVWSVHQLATYVGLFTCRSVGTL